MTNINPLRDPKTGKYLTTSNISRYKVVQYNGKRMGDHSREVCIALNIPFIPKGFVVHHLDEDKKNNNIDNLAIMTITAHNRIHAHEPWNKGITAKESKKWENAVYKQRLAREKTFLKKCEEAYNLKEQGKSFIEISKTLNINRSSASNRFKKYKASLYK